MTLQNAPDLLLATFVIFCRLSGCLMTMPGFSSPRVSIQVRLFLALSATLAISPLLIDRITPVVVSVKDAELLRIIVVEMLIGALIGLFGRIFFSILQMMVHAAASMTNFSMPMNGVTENQQQSPFTSMVMLSATALFFISGAHADVFVAIAESYVAIPVGTDFVAAAAIDQFSTKLVEASYLCLRIVAPFLVYSLIVNLTLGITNRMMPQMPVYFVGMPFVLFGGLFMLWRIGTELLELFYQGLGNWLLLE